MTRNKTFSQIVKQLFEKAWLETLTSLKNSIPQIIAVAAAFVIGAIVLGVTGHSPLEAYGSMLVGAFGDIYGIGQTLTQATPILFTALAFLLSFKCGLFNLGAEGQLLMGGFFAAVIGISFSDLPAFIHLPIALLAGILGGALWGFIPAILKAKLGAHEVITTMMSSYVALYVTSYFVNYPLKAPGWVSQTILVSASAELPRLLPVTQLSASFLLSITAAVATVYLLERTIIGYEIRAIGLNPAASENAGISTKKGMILALILSGAIAGIGGAGEVLGVHRRFIDGFSPGYGWDGLAVALIGGLNPLGSIIAAILFGAIRSGGINMNVATGVPLDIINMLQALVVLFVAAPKIFEYIKNKGGFKWLKLPT